MAIFLTAEETTWEGFLDKSSKFRVNTLTIPEYQRSYVWNDKKISSLLNGILLSYNQNRDNYFLGDVILCEEEKVSEGRMNYAIVDGQQRLTSLNLIASTIRQVAHERKFVAVEVACTEFIEASEKRAKFNLTLPDPVVENGGAHFRRLVQERNYNQLKNYVAPNGERGVTVDYILLLQQNFSAAYDMLHAKKEPFLQGLIGYIARKCRFFVKIVTDFVKAHQLFCTINNPGEQQSSLDFFKARFY
jgi:Protein of unknown function DUF262